ncbi:MAG: ATPase, T2SS/T4P/T4SS family [Terriglobales bacterium]
MSSSLGTLLLHAGIVDRQQLEEHLDTARRRNMSLWNYIVDEKQVSEESLAEAFSTWLKMPRVRLASAQVDVEAVKAIPEELARKHVCFPIKLEGKSLVVALANPVDYEALQDLQFASGMTVKTVVSSRTEIMDAIGEYYTTDQTLEDFLGDVSDVSDFRILGREEETNVDLMDGRSSAHLPPVVKICNLILRDAIKARASDVHVEAGLNAINIRYRVDGVLRDYMQAPKWLHNAVISRLKILAKLDIAEHRLPQDGRIKIQVANKPMDVRVSTLPTHYGEKVVMRLLGSSELPKLDKLGYNEKQREWLDHALSQPQGLVLVTGPTGSGKSTSLYAMLETRKSPELNIITIEDPIEYQLPGINQVQVNQKAGLTFASCLRSILRQDPDVILVGEIRDLETAEIAFHASMTGHLVLSTLHTNSAVASIARLLDLGVDPFSITGSLTLVSAQRLARRLCHFCKEEYTPAKNILEKLRVPDHNMTFYRGRGCQSCANTGYSGRIGIYEMLRVTGALKQMIHRKASEGEMRKAAGAAGTRFLLEDAMEKVRLGITTLEEVVRVIQLDQEDIRRCPRCEAYIAADFATCPYCMHALRYACEKCGQDLKLEWRICPYCNTSTMERTLPEETPDREERREPAEKEGAKSDRRQKTKFGRRATDNLQAPAPKQPRILLVDDDESIRTIVCKGLEQLELPVTVLTASDGVEALQKVQTDLVDMVILDVMMPRMDGFAVCERLRSDVRTAFIPILMLTASGDENNRTKAYMVGTDDYMTKPFAVPELNVRVARLLRRTYGV